MTTDSGAAVDGTVMGDDETSITKGDDTIIPDEKDWTWVLGEACPECGFDSHATDGPRVTEQVPDIVRRWQAVLARDEAEVRARPEPAVWSPLEYACHVRDVFEVIDERVRLMVEHDEPSYPNWDQDATAIERDYRSQEPAALSSDLAAAGGVLHRRLQAVQGEQWSRRGFRSNGSVFTIDSLARYFAHDVLHHLHDVRA